MFRRMFCKPMVHSGIYPIHCKRCLHNMGSEHSLVPKGCGLKLLYRGMIPTWFQRAMFIFLSCFVSCFKGLISLQFRKICFYMFLSCFYTFHTSLLHASYRFVTCLLRFLSMFLPCFLTIYFFQFCIISFYISFLLCLQYSNVL